MIYGAETWATTKKQENGYMCGVTRIDKIRNEHIRGTANTLPKDHGETIELVRAGVEESVENGYTGEREERTTEFFFFKRVPTRKLWESQGKEEGERRNDVAFTHWKTQS